ncbi:MAG: protein-glutamate O-methyltransferase CheR [Myxococcales bacterium]|nr:MAG: protein-glutamate O-methyltransferase CheR [Myxococcales bacterium]
MLAAPALSAASFSAIRELIRAVAGIAMTPEKEELVKARLASRLRELKLSAYEEYLERVKTDRVELSNMVDVLTTNKTSFFREPQHFDYLVQTVFPIWKAERRPRQIWSAGCSSGEEPYTLSMLLQAHLPTLEVRILATDLSLRVLTRAKAARYTEAVVQDVPSELRRKYLRHVPGEGTFQVAPEVTSRVSFARLNLMGDWPMKGPFDLILCRNVMIYFTDDTRTMLAQRYAALLSERGVLMIGHAESLASLEQPLRLIKPAIYAR